MELIDTPNPNAKKIITDLSENEIPKTLSEVDGVDSVSYTHLTLPPKCSV